LKVRKKEEEKKRDEGEEEKESIIDSIPLPIRASNESEEHLSYAHIGCR
jgi:hypothetical protein